MSVHATHPAARHWRHAIGLAAITTVVLAGSFASTARADDDHRRDRGHERVEHRRHYRPPPIVYAPPPVYYGEPSSVNLNLTIPLFH